jgi:hypothetical protein
MTQKTRVFTSCLGILLFAVTITAQDCRLYFPDKAGAVREMKSYDDKNKLVSITRQEITDKTVSGKDVTIKVRSTAFDAQEKEVYGADLEMSCKDGIFLFDMKSMIDPNTMASYKDMGMEVTTDNVIYPANLNIGDALPDANLKLLIKSGQTTLMTIAITVTNRKVVARESLTTEAGTFDCFKVSYDSVVKMGFITISGTAIEWVSDGVGVVRSESYNKKGKTTGYSVLTKLTR